MRDVACLGGDAYHQPEWKLEKSTDRKENDINIEKKTILITDASRGIARALVNEALKRGAKRVYAGTRRPLQIADERVTPLKLDVTSA